MLNFFRYYYKKWLEEKEEINKMGIWVVLTYHGCVVHIDEQQLEKWKNDKQKLLSTNNKQS